MKRRGWLLSLAALSTALGIGIYVVHVDVQKVQGELNQDLALWRSTTVEIAPEQWPDCAALGLAQERMVRESVTEFGVMMASAMLDTYYTMGCGDVAEQTTMHEGLARLLAARERQWYRPAELFTKAFYFAHGHGDHRQATNRVLVSGQLTHDYIVCLANANKRLRQSEQRPPTVIPPECVRLATAAES